MLDRSKAPVAASPNGWARIPERSEVRYARLKAEGNWGAFSEKKQRYRDQGWTSREADIMAHRDFPPPDWVETSDGVGMSDLGRLAGRSEAVRRDGEGPNPTDLVELDMSTPDIRRDAYWAYNHIGKEKITRKMAPSQGAWNMLQHFGHDSETIRDFLVEIAKPMLKSEPKGESYSDDGRELIALCERKRAEFVAEVAREEAV